MPDLDTKLTALDNLTAAGETTVTELVGILDAKWLALQSVDDSLQVLRAGPIELRGDELDARREAFNLFLAKLDATLFLPSQSLMPGGVGLQGPFAEP